MDITVVQKQISSEERSQISKQVRAELVEHLYEGCLPGTITGIVASVALFIDFYGYSPLNILIAWVIGFNGMMFALSGLYFLYKKYKSRLRVIQWEWAYSLMMIGCALAWVPVIYLLPNDIARQYLALIALFLATTGYSTGSIGQFKLCVVALQILLLPLIVWCFFMKGGVFYNIIGAYSLIYMFFLMGANFRSTKWFKDSLKLKLENTLVSYQANHDILTGLPNQRLLPQYIESAFEMAKTSEQTFALVSFSLNRMEIINDSLGAKASNSIIKTVAERLTSLVLAENNLSATQYIVTISRKDTFNILLVPLTEKEAEEKVKVLFSVLEEPFYLETREVQITASIGVCVYDKSQSDVQTIVANADAAMLQAKQFGGNRLEFYRSEINAASPKQLELENDLHIALKEKQFQVYYQPLVDAQTGIIVGSEALIRWLHPERGFISPMHFIPIAEQTGLIVPIGEWVLNEACKQTAEWQHMGFSKLKVAVNFAGKQLQEANIIDTVRRALIYTGLDAQFLEIELTETAILDEKVIHIIKEFKNLGLSLAVDDFGTGYSGLSYLKRFSIDKLKIDQSFVKDIPINKDSITIVSAILAMARELNVISLAEGVETEEQLDFLRSKGCDVIQGYYFSKPLETKSFTQLLLAHRHESMYAKVELS